MNKKKKEKEWKAEKAKLESLSLEDRRLGYGRSDYVSLEKIPTWRHGGKEEEEGKPGKQLLSDKISLYKGDITMLEVDAIVNAANSSLLGGGGVDGCIHKAAGPCLYDECHTLNGCETGKAKITCGYDLPARHVIHTVGPVARGHVGQNERDDLAACYQNSLRLLKENHLHTVAFPCISTGIYGFPNDPAAEIALRTVKSWIGENYAQVTRVIFCVFLETDYNIYKEKIPHIFHDNDVNKEPPGEGQDQGEGQLKEGNVPLSKDSKSKNPSGDSNADAYGDTVNPKANPDDVDMESQGGDCSEQTVPETDEKDVKGSTAGERKRTQTSSETEGDTKKDGGETEETEVSQDPMEGVEEASAAMESGTGAGGVEKAHGEGSQGSDLTQSDSIQSKEPVEKNE